MNRCTNETIGVQVLSYDLLAGDEKQVMDEHLKSCAACRDLLQQTFGSKGALDDLDARVFRLSQRQRVEPHAWMLQRFRDLWLPFSMIVLCVSFGVMLVARARRGEEGVRVMSLAVSRAGILDADLTQRIGADPEAILVRTDRPARAAVYEAHANSMRRLLPGSDAAAPLLAAGETRELTLPPLMDSSARVLLVLIPADDKATVVEWDAAMMEYLGRGQQTRWPAGANPTLRWIQ